MDANKEPYSTAMCMFELCNCRDISGSISASTDDPIWAFIVGLGDDITELVFSFKFRAKRGKGDLRGASKAKLLEVVLEMGLHTRFNKENMECWGVIVDCMGEVIEGGTREAVSRGMMCLDQCDR